MDRNIRIAREIVRIAKELVAFKYKNTVVSLDWDKLDDYGLDGSVYNSFEELLLFKDGSDWIVVKTDNPFTFYLETGQVNKNWFDDTNINDVDCFKEHKKFHSSSDMAEYVKETYGCHVPEELYIFSDEFEMDGIKYVDIAENMDKDNIKKMMSSTFRRIEKSLGRDKIKKYYPDRIIFESQYDNDEHIGGANYKDGTICIESTGDYQKKMLTIIHEISHSILDKNSKLKEIIKRKFKEYTEKQKKSVSFKQGDIIGFKFVNGEVAYYYALDDFNPSEDCNVYPQEVFLQRIGFYKNGNPDFQNMGDEKICYKKMMGAPIERIIRKNGNKYTDVTKNTLGLRQYAFINYEEFIAEILSNYCMKTLPKKLVKFVEEEVIPNL